MVGLTFIWSICLTARMADARRGGWTNYLARLSAVAENRDPGRRARSRTRSVGPQVDTGVSDRAQTPGEKQFWRCGAALGPVGRQPLHDDGLRVSPPRW